MAHFAKVVNGIVQQVIVAEQDFIDMLEPEQNTQWIQTSYNTRGGIHYQPNSTIPSKDQSKALRKNFAGIGFIYDEERDAFYTPMPNDNTFEWVFNEETCQWDPIEIGD